MADDSVTRISTARQRADILLHDNVQIRALVEALQSLWMNADLHVVEVREIAVQRTFVDFKDFWTTSMMAATVNQAIAAMAR